MKYFVSKSKKKLILIILFLFFLYTIYTLWPVRSLIGPFLSGKTLVVMTNENEARPCGGFASVYGVVSVFSPKVELKNVYALADSAFGETTYPLSKVAKQKRFWDMGIDTNLETCSEGFKQAYQFARKEDINHVLLVDFQTLEKVGRLFKTLSFQGESFDSSSLFSVLSRSVANVDRHNEEALATRKSPLASFGKSLIGKSLFNPLIPPRITRIVREQMDAGRIYSSKQDTLFRRQGADFSVVEWNLGGGKSSRYLQKNVTVSGREIEPEKWQWKVRFSAQHLGGFDEPLSQPWNGVWEFKFPLWLEQPSQTKEVVIMPGEQYQQGFIFDTTGALPSDIGLFSPRGQSVSYDVSISTYGQQILRGMDSNTESVGRSSGVLDSGRVYWELSVEPDTVNPFVTIHTIVPLESLPEQKQAGFDSDLLVELHINENVSIDLESFAVTMADTNHTNKEHTVHPEMVVYDLMPDQRTLYIGFRNTQKQLNERYALTISGLKDIFGNSIAPSARTVIDRVPVFVPE